MIRVLVIGPEASAWCEQLRPVAPSADFEPARLPAAGVRAFEKSPADVVVLCGSQMARERLEAVVSALRERPLGRLVPCVWIGAGELADTDARLEADAAPDTVVAMLAELVGVAAEELRASGSVSPRLDAPVTQQLIERKLRQVRHETYFEVLEVSPDASDSRLREAFTEVAERFTPQRLSDELSHRFTEELAEVRDGIEDAYAVLSNHKLRAAYAGPRGSGKSRE